LKSCLSVKPAFSAKEEIRMRVTNILPILVGLAAFGLATERGAAQGAEAAFDRLDADRSGAVTWAEAYEVRTDEFMDMDANMDGIVTENEFQGPARPFSAFDADDDGDLQLAEFLEAHRSMFDRFDEDASGSLTFEEFEAARSAARAN